MKRGKFIVIEGTEGTGKTIQSKILRDKLEELDIPVYHTMECSEGPIGKIIRNTYLSGERVADRRLINYLYAADRLDHITNTVDGMLRKILQGINVVCDRYYLTSLALYPLEYLDTPDYMKQMEFICSLNQAAYELLPPDITIVLEMDPMDIAKRLNGRQDKIEIYDNAKDIENSIRTYQDAIAMLRARGESIVEVDGRGSTWKVHARIWDHVRYLFNM